MLLLLTLLATVNSAQAGTETVRATARQGVTVAGLRAAQIPVEVSAFTYQKIEWLLMCKAVFEPNDEPNTRAVSCTLRSGSISRQATSSSFIGETEKNLVVRVPAQGAASGVKVEVSGLEAD